MLVISRKRDQGIQIGEGVSIRILDIDRNRVRLGIDAPREVKISRDELCGPGESEPGGTSASMVFGGSARGSAR